MRGGRSARRICCSMLRSQQIIGLAVVLAIVVLVVYRVFIWQPKQVMIERAVLTKQPPKVIPEAKLPKVRVTVFMESFCPDTSDFLANQLSPTWAKIHDIMDVTIVPYGKAHTKQSGTGGDFTFQCQHGPKECLGNQYMCCGIDALGSLGLKDQIVPFVNCAQEHVLSETAKCAGQAGLTQKNLLKCANGPTGRKLHAKAGDQTNALSPRLHFIPWVMINGARIPEALEDLKKVICDKYTGPKKASYCA